MYKKRFTDVLGHQMAFVDVGAGDPIVFLHGNPTSSYLWRHVMAECEGLGRLIAPDLIGMGDSEKLDPSGKNSYRFIEHRMYLDALLHILDVTDAVSLVVHDWGSALGFDWANRHRTAVKGIAYMEAIVRPVTWDEWPESARGFFQGMRSEAGDGMILEKNMFVERVLPASIMRELEPHEHDAYRRPFAEIGEHRRPTLTWPREIPIDGHPVDVHEIVASYAEWLATSDVPKLFVNADPGSILVGAQREFCRTWPNQQEVTVPGIHFIQEDSGEVIGRAIAGWYGGL
ncbi:MAG: haloalkane dehalogenase [Acidimicrobiia bacterium]|nr:haloalkane dehalogenase [Acidimicrobiia bacterium]